MIKNKFNLKTIVFLLSVVMLLVSVVAVACFSNSSKSQTTNLAVEESEEVVSNEEQVLNLLNQLDEYVDLLEENEFFEESIDVQTLANKTWIIQVCLINPNDANVFTQDKIDGFVKRFNEDIDNDFLSVHEFYDKMSKGKWQVWANIFLCQVDKPLSYYADAKSSNVIKETLIWAEANDLSDKELVSERNYGLNNAMCSILPCSRGDVGDLSWPHAYATGLMSLPFNKADVPTLCHESLHMLGLLDLYTNVGVDVVCTYDCMAETYNGNVSLSAYSREKLGFISSSKYNDSRKTEIEELSADGVYTLNGSLSSTGTICYTFGKKGSQKFYIEYRKQTNTFESNVSGSGLLVYRADSDARGNLNYPKTGMYEMYVFPTNSGRLSNYNGYIKAGKSFGSFNESSKLKFTYRDGGLAPFIIDNVVENNDGTISFRITTPSNGEYVTDASLTMDDVKIKAVNGLMDTFSTLGGIIYNPRNTIKTLANEVSIYVQRPSIIGISVDAISSAINGIVRNIQGGYENNTTEEIIPERISNGVDFIVEGIQTTYTKIESATTNIVEKVQTLANKFVSFLKKKFG